MMSKKQVTIVVDGEVYDALRKAVSPKKISYEIEDLMEKRLAELKGTEYRQEEHVDYEALKREHIRLVREVDRQEKWLRKRKVYDDLARLAVKVGLSPKDLSGLEEAAPKMMSEWKGLKEDVHLFITLLENVRAKRELERKLDEIRIMRAASRQAPV
jgi:response regulator RpfG family c-di-GMP phosphodiesterase